MARRLFDRPGGLMSRPLKLSLVLSLSFLIVSAFYLVFSDQFVAAIASSTEQLKRLQSIKGLSYVTLVSAGLFGLSYVLLKRLQNQYERLKAHREKMLSLERQTVTSTLAASIAHDARNLVSIVKGNLEMIVRGNELDSPLEGRLEDAKEASNQLSSLVTRLKDAGAKSVAETTELVNLSELVNDSIRTVKTHSKCVDRYFCVESVDDETIQAYPELLVHALFNLVLNAAEATGPGGRIRISAERLDEQFCIAVEDDGPGIPDEHKSDMKRPFETTKSEGTGLGLFSVDYCAKLHGGELEIDSSSLGGAKMVLRLPAEEADHDPQTGFLAN
jgi:signal transduction histidine kinase